MGAFPQAGPQGPAGAAGSDAPALAVMHQVASGGILVPNTSPRAIGANNLDLIRTVAPISGTLTDLAVWVAAGGGNLLGSAYDTGDAQAGVRTRLWKGAATPAGGGNAWVSLGNPNLPVVKGRHYDLGVTIDNAAITLGAANSLTGGSSAQLPAGYLSVPGAVGAKLVGAVAVGAFDAPATIAEAALTVPTNLLIILGKIT